MMPKPFLFEWDGESLKPATKYWAPKCDEYFVIGERYQMIEHDQPRPSSRGHYFASLHEAWANLPEAMAERFHTSEHLRKYALIKTGWHDSNSIVLPTNADALRVASFIRPKDEFAVIIVDGNTVTDYTAQSQSARAMGKAKFQKSKWDVIDYVASLVGLTTEELKANAGKAA